MNDSTLLTATALILGIAASALLIYGLYMKNHPRAGKSAPVKSVSTPQALAVDPAALEKIQDAPAPQPKAEPNPELERRRLSAAMVGIGFLIDFLSLYLRPDLPITEYWAYIPFLAIGILLVVGGIFLASQLGQRVFFESAIDWMAVKLDVRPAQCVCLLTGILTAGLATVAAGTSARMISPVVAVGSWITGIALTILGGWHFAPSAGGSRLPRSAWVWTLLLTLFAFLVRAVVIGQIPVVLSGDEGSTGLDALLILTGKVNNPFGIFGWHPFPALYFSIESLGISIFGRTIEALRYPSALAGALTVGGLYLVARAMYGHRYGLAAAVFLSALHLDMQFSRLGLMNIWDGLWYLATLGTLWYGWKSGRRAYWIAAGLACGIGQYFYATTRTLFAAVPLWLAIAAVVDRTGWRRNLKNLLPALAALLAVLLPLAWFAYTHPDQYLGDVKANSIFGSWLASNVREQALPAWRILLKQLGLGFGAFFNVNLSFWYRPDAPILRALPAAFFLFGLAILCLRLRDPRTWVPLLWLAAYGMIASLSTSAPAAQRLPGVSPACALVVGIGVVELASILAGLLSTRKWLVGVAAILLVGYMAADDLRFYFFEYTPESQFQGRHDFVGIGGAVSADIVRLLKDEPGQWEVVFFPNQVMGYRSDPALRYLLPNVNGMDILKPWGASENPAIPEGNLFFVFMPGREDDLPRVTADYPGGQTHVVHAPNGSVLYSYYRYPPGL